MGFNFIENLENPTMSKNIMHTLFTVSAYSALGVEVRPISFPMMTPSASGSEVWRSTLLRKLILSLTSLAVSAKELLKDDEPESLFDAEQTDDRRLQYCSDLTSQKHSIF